MANFNDRLGNISRRQAFAEMLRKQGMDMSGGLGQTQMVSGRAVKNDPYGGINAIVSQLLGAYMQKKAGEEADMVKEQQRQDMQDWAQALMRTQEEAQFSPVEQQPTPELMPQQTEQLPMSPVEQPQNQLLMPEMAAQGPEEVYAQPLEGNARFAHLLQGLDKGGYAAQIAGSQLSNMMSPRELKPVGGVPGVVMDQRGNFFDSAGTPLTSQQVQDMARAMRKASATNVSVGGATDLVELAKTLMDERNLTWDEAIAQAQYMASSAAGATPTDVAPQPRQPAPAQVAAQAPPEQAVDAAQESPAQVDNPLLSSGYVRGGQLTGEGRKIQETWRDQEAQKDLYTSSQNSVQNLESIEEIIRILAEGRAKVGPAFGSKPIFQIQKLLGEIGIGSANELDNALKRIQTAEKIVMIGQSGVRAFDTEKEMENLVMSIGDETLTVDALINSLDQIYDRSRANLKNARNVYGFLDAVGTPPSYSEFDPTYQIPSGETMDMYKSMRPEENEETQLKPWERNWN